MGSANSVQILVKNNEISLIGVLTFDTTAKALKLITEQLSDEKNFDQKTVVLNLFEITKSDSSGLALLTGIMRAAEKNNLILNIKNMPKKLFDLALLSGLDSVLLLD